MTKIENGIYFKASEDQSTHFIAYKDGKILDPYNYYQFPQTHGFCQMFAFFMFTGNVNHFKKVHITESTFSATEFNKYVHNSYTCLQQIIQLLKKPKYKVVRDAFERDFNNSTTTPRGHFGIERGTTFEQFLSDLEKIPVEQVFVEMVENYEAYGEEIEQQSKKKKFQQQGIKFFKAQQGLVKNNENKYKTIPELCVSPTDGETQYEAFQAIIANSFRAGRNSVYSKLLKIDNIKLIEKDIYELVEQQ